MIWKNLTARSSASPALVATARLRWFACLALIVVGAAWLGTRTGSAFPLNRLAFLDDNAVAGLITGTVFQDYNANGRRDTAATITNADGSQLPVAFDRGVAGVTVTAYAADGSSAGSATTAGWITASFCQRLIARTIQRSSRFVMSAAIKAAASPSSCRFRIQPVRRV